MGIALRWRHGLGAAFGAVVLGVGVLAHVRTPAETPVTRGLALASELGCFGCHGPGGAGGHANPGTSLEEVPPLAAGGPFAFFVQDEAEIREWILRGRPARLQASPPSGVIRMPAYESHVTAEQLEDLVALVRFLSETRAPAPPAAREGLAVATRLGCFACHGNGGRGQLGNPGSFKGVIPSWEGADFEELVHDEGELRQWILDGISARFRTNPLARHFLDGQAIQMPSYRGVCSETEVESLVAYFRWLRTGAAECQERVATDVADFVERGRWLYRSAGCAACHGARGEGGVPNANAAGGFVPALQHTAERLQLFEREDAQRIVRALEHGDDLAATELLGSDPAAVEVELRALRVTLMQGSRPARSVPEGREPPILMPPWAQRMHADGGPLQPQDVDAVIAHLLTLESWPE